MIKKPNPRLYWKFCACHMLGLILAVVSLWSWGAKAQVELYAWDRGPMAAAVVIPVPEGADPLQTWQ